MKLMLVVFMMLMMLAPLVAKIRDWKNGTLISIEERKELVIGKKSGSEERFWSYSIDAGDVIYEAERASKRPIQVEINGPVSFVLDGKHLILRDGSDHEFKLLLLKTTRKK
jgi:hypothetical protein